MCIDAWMKSCLHDNEGVSCPLCREVYYQPPVLHSSSDDVREEDEPFRGVYARGPHTRLSRNTWTMACISLIVLLMFRMPLQMGLRVIYLMVLNVAILGRSRQMWAMSVVIMFVSSSLTILMFTMGHNNNLNLVSVLSVCAFDFSCLLLVIETFKYLQTADIIVQGVS